MTDERSEDKAEEVEVEVEVEVEGEPEVSTPRQSEPETVTKPEQKRSIALPDPKALKGKTERRPIPWALIRFLVTILLQQTIPNLRQLLSAPMCEAKSPGLLSITAFFRCITVGTQWVPIKTPVKFIGVINGLIAVKNFVNDGIRCHLTPIITAIRLRILNR